MSSDDIMSTALYFRFSILTTPSVPSTVTMSPSFNAAVAIFVPTTARILYSLAIIPECDNIPLEIFFINCQVANSRHSCAHCKHKRPHICDS